MRRVQAEMLWAISLASYLMARADGLLAKEEIEALNSSLSSLAEENISAEQLGELLDSHEALLQKVGFDGAAQALTEKLPDTESRRAALIMAATLCFVDGDVSDDENEAFDSLAEHLGFSEEETEEILEEVFADE